MATLYFLYFTFVLLSSVTGYLNRFQQIKISKILQNPNSTEMLKNRVKKLLAYHYYPWASSQYNNFKRIRHIGYSYNDRDLQEYAYLGLLKSLKKYDGRSSLPRYADKYVTGEICRGIRELRKSSKIYETVRYENVFSSPIKNDEEENISYNRIKSVNEIVSTFSPEDRMLFYYRYDKDTLEIIRSVKSVCQLMVFSDETYRQKMDRIKNQIMDDISVKPVL
jgi:RNA polymerase sigma factor (sigma-70 family)